MPRSVEDFGALKPNRDGSYRAATSNRLAVLGVEGLVLRQVRVRYVLPVRVPGVVSTFCGRLGVRRTVDVVRDNVKPRVKSDGHPDGSASVWETS